MLPLLRSLTFEAEFLPLFAQLNLMWLFDSPIPLLRLFIPLLFQLFTASLWLLDPCFGLSFDVAGRLTGVRPIAVVLLLAGGCTLLQH